MEVDTRRIVGCAIGRRDGESAKALWDSLPEAFRRCGKFFTDFWEPYASVFPKEQRRPVGKETGLTSYLERFNNTLRQRLSRLVRKSMAFSKKIQNHVGAVFYFLNHYNTSLRP